MTYKETDNLSTLKVRDTLIMNDGSKHLAVKDPDIFSCKICSMYFNKVASIFQIPSGNECRALYAKCMTGVFHFEQIKP